MDAWIILLIIGVVFLILEMFTPVLFFMNLSIASFVAAIFAYNAYSLTAITFIFLFVSIFSIVVIRPFLLKLIEKKNKDTGIEDKYIGKTAKVVEEVSLTKGRIAIYGEEWQAVTKEGCIPVGADVKILSNESIVFTVEKI